MFGSIATLSPTFNLSTEGWTARTVPADSWPKIWVPVTIIGPMQPACQKCTSELPSYQHRFQCLVLRERNSPANSCALYLNRHLSRLETVALFDAFKGWLSFRNPQIMCRVRKNSNIALRRPGNMRKGNLTGCRGRHIALERFFSWWIVGRSVFMSYCRRTETPFITISPHQVLFLELDNPAIDIYPQYLDTSR